MWNGNWTCDIFHLNRNLFYRVNVFVRQNNVIVDAQSERGISAAVVNSKLSSSVVRDSSYFKTLRVTFVSKYSANYCLDLFQGYTAVSSEKAAEMKVLSQAKPLCFSKSFSRLDIMEMKDKFTPLFAAMHQGRIMST